MRIMRRPGNIPADAAGRHVGFPTADAAGLRPPEPFPCHNRPIMLDQAAIARAMIEYVPAGSLPLP
jgi:hypothetical protein